MFFRFLPRYAFSLVALIALIAPTAFSQGPEFTIKITPENTSVAPGDTVRVVVGVAMSEGFHVNSNTPEDEFSIPTTITLDEHAGVAVTETIYPEHKTFIVDKQELQVFDHTFDVTLALKIADDIAIGSLPLTGTLRVQACNDTMCFPPENIDLAFSLNIGAAGAPTEATPESGMVEATPATADTPAPAKDPEAAPSGQDWKTLVEKFTVVNSAGYEKTDAFLAFLDAGLSGEVAPSQGSVFANKSWGLIILLIVVGGLALNLTPCVLPLIPINIAIIGAGTKARSRGRGFALGSVYGVGIALVYGLLGLAVMLSFATAFGTINATPWFNALIAVLFVVLGLAMFDIIQIDFTRFQTKLGIKKNEKGSFLVAFLMGSVSALLAGACVAPVVISTILFAQDSYSQGNQLALALPFLLGVGMALPWPFVGAGLSVLPKPGMWMVRVKQAFGVFIIGFAIYYGYIAYGLMQSGTATGEGNHEGWFTSLEGGLAEATETGQPVFIDFWATWCKNCSVMDQTTLVDPAVVEKLEAFVKIRYQAEKMDEFPTKEIVEYFDVVGLPAYLILQPKE